MKLSMLNLLLVRGVDDADKGFLYWHNVVRCEVGTPPLEWDETLANYARNHASGSYGEHSDSYGNVNAGENMATHKSAKGATLAWFGEFDAWANGGGGVTGHYTAMVWKSGKTLGCATASFSSCNYGVGEGGGVVPNMNLGSEGAKNCPKAKLRSREECIKAVESGDYGSLSDGSGVTWMKLVLTVAFFGLLGVIAWYVVRWQREQKAKHGEGASFSSNAGKKMKSLKSSKKRTGGQDAGDKLGGKKTIRGLE